MAITHTVDGKASLIVEPDIQQYTGLWTKGVERNATLHAFEADLTLEDRKFDGTWPDLKFEAENGLLVEADLRTILLAKVAEYSAARKTWLIEDKGVPPGEAPDIVLSSAAPANEKGVYYYDGGGLQWCRREFGLQVSSPLGTVEPWTMQAQIDGHPLKAKVFIAVRHHTIPVD